MSVAASSASNSLMLGKLRVTFSGSESMISDAHSATPIGEWKPRNAYSATTEFLVLQSNRPMVGSSPGYIQPQLPSDKRESPSKFQQETFDVSQELTFKLSFIMGFGQL